MADPTASYMRGLDGPRELPARMRERLEGALVSETLEPADENLLYILDRPKRLPADMQARLTEVLVADAAHDDTYDDEFAAHFEGLDAPRPLPTAMRARLMDRLMHRHGATSRLVQISGAAAAAVLILVATVFFTARDNAGRTPGKDIAITPLPTLSNTIPPQPSATPTTPVQPSVRPTAAPKPTRGTKVLGVKEVRKPPANAPAPLTPDAAPTGGVAAPTFDGRTAARAPSPAPTPTDLVGSVVDLVRNLLGALNLDVLSAGNPSSSVAGNAPATPAAPEAPASKPATKRSSTVKKPAATPPKATTPKPAATPKPLLQLPLLSDEPVIVVEVPAVELTISL